MKLNLLKLTFILLSGTASYAQQRDSLYKNADFEILSAKFFNSRSYAPQTGVVIDVAKRTKLKSSVPIHQGNLAAVFINTEITSNNDFIPLFDKGKWAPSLSTDLSYTLFLNRDSRYDVGDNGTLSKPSFLKPEQGFWIWTTASLGYNYNSYLFFLDNNHPDIERQLSRKNYHNLAGKGNVGFFLAPFYGEMSWLSFAGGIGFEYRQNDNNYFAMRSVMLNTYRKIDASNSSAEIYSDKTSAKQGLFIVTDASMLNYNLSILIDADNNLSFGLNLYGRTRLTPELKSTDLGFGFNIPFKRHVDNERRVFMNMNINYDLIDVGNNLNPNFNYSDKGYLSLGLAVPIYSLSYK